MKLLILIILVQILINSTIGQPRSKRFRSNFVRNRHRDQFKDPANYAFEVGGGGWGGMMATQPPYLTLSYLWQDWGEQEEAHTTTLPNSGQEGGGQRVTLPNSGQEGGEGGHRTTLSNSGQEGGEGGHRTTLPNSGQGGGEGGHRTTLSNSGQGGGEGGHRTTLPNSGPEGGEGGHSTTLSNSRQEGGGQRVTLPNSMLNQLRTTSSRPILITTKTTTDNCRLLSNGQKTNANIRNLRWVRFQHQYYKGHQLGVSFYSTIQACQQACLNNIQCYSVDYNGLCWLNSYTDKTRVNEKGCDVFALCVPT